MDIFGKGNQKRYITITRCKGMKSDNGKPESYECIIIGKQRTPETATKRVVRETHDRTIVIEDVTIEEHYYKVKTSDFIRYATCDEKEDSNASEFSDEELATMRVQASSINDTEHCVSYRDGIFYDEEGIPMD